MSYTFITSVITTALRNHHYPSQVPQYTSACRSLFQYLMAVVKQPVGVHAA